MSEEFEFEWGYYALSASKSNPGPPGGSHNPGSPTLPTGGDLLPTGWGGGIVGKEQPRHEKAIPMGPVSEEVLLIVILLRLPYCKVYRAGATKINIMMMINLSIHFNILITYGL